MICRSALRATIGAPKPKRLMLCATRATAAALLRGFLSHGFSSVIGTQIAAASNCSSFSCDIGLLLAPWALKGSGGASTVVWTAFGDRLFGPLQGGRRSYGWTKKSGRDDCALACGCSTCFRTRSRQLVFCFGSLESCRAASL